MKSRYLIATGGLIMLSAIMILDRIDDSTEEQLTNVTPLPVASSIEQEPKPSESTPSLLSATSQRRPDSKPTAEIRPFHSPGGVHRLRSALTRAEDMLDEAQGRDMFADSGLDTPQTYQDAVTIIHQPYRLPMSKGDITRKVLALHFLGMSRHTSIDEVTELLESVRQRYATNDVSDQARHALLWDGLALAKICVGIDPTRLEDVMASMLPGPLRAQFGLALAN